MQTVWNKIMLFKRFSEPCGICIYVAAVNWLVINAKLYNTQRKLSIINAQCISNNIACFPRKRYIYWAFIDLDRTLHTCTQ